MHWGGVGVVVDGGPQAAESGGPAAGASGQRSWPKMAAPDKRGSGPCADSLPGNQRPGGGRRAVGRDCGCAARPGTGGAL
ncbi:unnamed protein product [Rangifer tarandus platyrhynchus]|uniref:Uncharacterized protein n=1 Tax=Rangifer tarandus platyrhynchus TaxID=3082113 RepID=A0AC59ZEV9_RANTA